MKKLLFSFCAILALSSSVFAQTLPGRYGPLLSNPQASSQWFFKQTKIASPYNQNTCSAVYTSERYYLSGDRDGDGLPDIYNPFYLKDNFAITSNSPNSTYRVALIAPTFSNFTGTEVFYYIPAGGSNALSIRTGGQNYSLATNNVWFRLSKIAPINQWVRAVTSEPVLLEIPASRNPIDAHTQIAYQIRYATYRGNTGSLNSGYQVFPVANSGDFGAAFDSWFLNNNFSHNSGIGPSWPGDYVHTSVSIPRAGITRGPEQTHALECKNYYTSRCGDGYRDVSGQQPVNASGTLPYTLPLGGGINEQCDPGSAQGQTVPYIPSGNQPGTTCSQTCTLITPQATQYADPIIMKFQRNVTRDIPQNGQYMTGMLNYSSGNQIEYKIVISNPSTGLSTHTGISLREQLPVGFVYATTNPVSLVIGGTVIPNTGVSYSTTTHQSSSFQLAPGASVTFFIRGTLLTNSPIMRTNTANLYIGNAEIDDSDVTMNYNTPLTPSLSIVKYQRIRPGATNYIMSGSLPTGPTFVTTPLTGSVGDMIDYRIRVVNTGAGTAYLSTIVDNAINAGILGLNCPVLAVSNMYHVTSFPIITSAIYKVPNQALWTFSPTVALQTNHSVDIYFSCLIVSGTSTYTNSGSATWSAGNTNTTAFSNTVVVTTPLPPLPSITLNKEIKTGGMANYGQYEDGHNGALMVRPGETISYRITVTKSGSAISQVHLSDVRPSCFTPTSASINNVPISPFMSYNLNQLNTVGNVTVTLILSGYVPLSATGCGIERNTAILSLPIGYPYTIIDPWGNQSGISTIAPIRDTADFVLIGNTTHTNLWLEKTVSPPFAEGNVENIFSQVGGLGRFTLDFGNTGNTTATGVVINDTLPAGLTCIRYFVDGGLPIPCSGNNFTYAYGFLLPGASGQISLEFVINTGTNTTFFLNTGYLTYNNISISDTASVTLLSNPGFTITKTVNTGVLVSGQNLTYTIRFINTGSQLSSYYIMDPLSSALTYVTGSATLNGLPRAPVQLGNILFWGCNAGSSGTNLNTTSVCPLISGGSGTIVFQALVH